MSWAAHNPEKYDEIVMKGVVKWMDGLLSKHGYDVPGDYLEAFEFFAECTRHTPEAYSIWQELLHVATQEIIEAEKDYFGRQVDGAMNAHRDR